MRKIVLTGLLLLIALHSEGQNFVTGTDSLLYAPALQSVTISGQRGNKITPLETTLNTVTLKKADIMSNLSGSLMQTLSGIPGVQAMTIGSGSSKPAIRGLGFNRTVVSENGVKHDGQQWGEDHGLEIDQFSVDEVEIIKGPASLAYGSDAIGGVISLQSNVAPKKKFGGSVRLFTRSNNESIGGNAQIYGRKKRFWYRADLTYTDYADYMVPADSIRYYDYNIALYRHRVRNTAGKDRNGSVTFGYTGNNVSTNVKVSDVYSKSGFFADAHGLEVRLSDIDYNRSIRDIDLPYQFVNHFKVVSNTKWNAGNSRWIGTLAYQNNIREEHSEPVSHGYMPKPTGTLERRYVKHTASAALGMTLPLAHRNTLSAGFNVDYQHNRRGGWDFVIPDFGTVSEGLYVSDKWQANEQWAVSAGIRLDGIHTHIHSYHDWYPTPQANGDLIYMKRASKLNRSFFSFTYSAGVSYAEKGWAFKANIGKSFRAPSPQELGIDGINYNVFRYEKGNAALKPEQSYQLDAGVSWTGTKVEFALDPYINYFPNYIYLNPTSSYVEGLQSYYYTQSRVFRYGMEASLAYRFLPDWKLGLKGEYLYAVQLSGNKKGYSLPFSPPGAVHVELTYSLPETDRKNGGFFTLDLKLAARQDRIVPPEKSTPGYVLLNVSAGKDFALGNSTLKLNLKVQNLLNTKYYDHTSYYRLIDLPEPGCDVFLMVEWVF
ncbi:MAG: TonB-dependent receptor [Bacteroides sp.]|nr:TonB-dependent receptor [Bacteroides sp.]